MSQKTYEQYKQPLIRLAKRFGIGYNIDNPITIQDKLNWLKIYDSTPLKTKCADKIRLREYCKEKIGKDICVPIIKIYNSTKDIIWDELPNQFVLKCNHGSGMNIIVKDKAKLNIKEAERKLNDFMNVNFAFKVAYEMHYNDIEHKIFAEQYIEDEKQQTSLLDYKFWCFNGIPKFLTVNDGHGHGNMKFLNMDFEILDMERTDFKTMEQNIDKPYTFSKMVEYATILSKDFKFVRADFYEVNKQLFLGELTFIPGAALFKYKNPTTNKMVGDMLDINQK